MVLSQWHDGPIDTNSGTGKLAFGFLSVSLATMGHHLSSLSTSPIYVFKDNVKLIDGYGFGGFGLDLFQCQTASYDPGQVS